MSVTEGSSTLLWMMTLTFSSFMIDSYMVRAMILLVMYVYKYP